MMPLIRTQGGSSVILEAGDQSTETVVDIQEDPSRMIAICNHRVQSGPSWADGCLASIKKFSAYWVSAVI